MEFLNLNIEGIIREKMGDFYPNDLVWIIEEKQICFHNAKTPDMSSCFSNTDLIEEDFDQIISIINHCHKREWFKTNEDKLPIDHAFTVFDYRDLLKRYIEHVECEEGINFIGGCHTSEGKYVQVVFSPKEVEELYKLESEYKKENNIK